MNKDLEFIMEEGKLEETLKILNNEILNYLSKRKNITDYIVDYRKKVIEEYRDDEDKVIEYFDHENYVKEEAFKTIDKRLKEFTILKDSPYFGKITFTEEDEGAEEFYIGRFGLTPEDSYDPVIVDWRAPVASLFYKGALGETTYECPNGAVNANLLGRRQLIVKKGELKGLFDSAIDVKDDILQMVLTSNSSEKLKDIVMTIQEEQDEIIRAPKDKVVVVNGVAGSGKTTIALHRVSYLLYNFRKQFGDKVLILGPNDIFMDYIGQVLPTLGESGVTQMTFQNFAISEIGLEEPVKGFSEYIEEAMSGNEEALKEYKYKSSKKFTELLDKTLEKMNEEYFEIQPVRFFDEEIVSVDEIKELFTKYYGYMPLFRRSEKIKRILTSKIKDKRDELVRELEANIKEEISKLSPDELEIEKNNLLFKRRIRIREIVRGVMNSRDELESWINHEDTVSLYKRITNTEALGYMDLAGILYLMVMLEGKKCKKEYKHVVIDEAQDYNTTQFKLIKELTGCKSYTIVGDSNQRLITTLEEPAMLNLEEVFGDAVKEFSLLKSYRSTQQIMEYASQFLNEDKVIPLVREGEPVIEEETTSKEDLVETIVSIIEDYQEDGLESIAVITKNKENMPEISGLLKERIKIMSFDRDDLIYNGGNVLIPAYYAKGLEFDGVIILEEGEETPSLVKYIMCTRALHRLSIIKKQS
ncbi:AAA family ATPase [Clostridium paraputrificum]|uniref:HelD family protein n=1 Tax=Clostridium paraputrificum TaxID=29363 RepID=UPI000668D143|nr:UvrD-helicase domain-containing protein [Clostridium paraputrificum]MDB2074930.1 AAA family ATPase [Clostridium paraputrificum]MDB2078287.1 AAA family ATPase [Clostridium paraputrificum]MDB2098701.1 AAA family ATPase [Clostridium paraputrificum]MDB2106177.1 AAA family ATPase [Clostridium paraputrificum]MDB2112868.1 AAA family ATPase [Clostridium paraputrificum]